MLKLDLGTVVLRDERVLLRPLELEDAVALGVAASGPRDTFGYTPVPEGEAGAQAYIRQALEAKASGIRYPFAIQFDDRVVGTTSYYDFQPWQWPADCPSQRADRPDALEIGHTWLSAAAQRTVCNTSSKLLLLGHAFDTWQVHRVYLRTDARNQRSRRAIERLGAQLDGVLRGYGPATDCTVRDTAYYSILRAEWPAVHARLRGMLASSPVG